MQINKEDDIAADVLLIKSSLDSGMCFVDTMNLDGETNLKDRMTPKETMNISSEEISTIQGYIICEKPNENLDKWEATLRIEGVFSPILCSNKQLLLKGCKLKNTEYIYGIVIYAGHSTKIMKNAKNPPIKTSNVMRVMNKLLYSVFIFQFLLCVFFSMGYMIWQGKTGTSIQYLKLYEGNVLSSQGVKAADFFIKFLTFLVAYSHLIPISLYVALELVKMIQSILIGYDTQMFDILTGKSANARTSDLIEELGQVEFVFSDKTGTLTKNEMEFRKCSINYKIYGSSENKDMDICRKALTVNGDTKPYQILNSKDEKMNQDKERIYDFFNLMAVCHSAYVEEKEHGELVYQSSSPDEVALILGSAQMGFKFIKKTAGTIEIEDHKGEYQIYDLILELPFDSTRKRMSVVVKLKNSDDKNIYLYTKGADTAMLGKMNMDVKVEKRIKDNLNSFAKEGLRTLVMAKKILEEKMVEAYKEKYNNISMSNDKDKENQMCDLFEEIETGFFFVGSSAIEDKLQDGVPETIESLMNANIRVWVLTGDKKVY